jgi:porin
MFECGGYFCIRLILGIAAATATVTGLHAQSYGSTPDILVPSTINPNATTIAAPATPYSNLSWKGINVVLPPASNTIDQDLFGMRPALADAGIAWFGFSQNTEYTNVLHAARTTGGRQVYNGQSPTGLSANFLGITYDLSRYGIPDGQIVAVGFYTSTTWTPLGPNSLNVGALSYYQTAFDKHLEIKIGLLNNSFEYAGPYVAGSLNAGTFGPSGSLFFQGGLSNLITPTYGFNVTVHPTEQIYDKFGISRALNPDGAVFEHNNNPTGMNWSTTNAGTYYINELGYLRASAPGVARIWLRGGASSSSSRYQDLDHPGNRATGDYTLYALGDLQVLQTSSAPGEARRGVYVGFSTEYSPPSLARFSQYYEGRIYGIGLLPGRPADQTSFLITSTTFSQDAVAAARKSGLLAHGASQAITYSYSALVIHGLYLNAAVSYINHPSAITYTSSTGSALNVIVGFSVFF